jgi:DNA-binding NtrC family response regulator
METTCRILAVDDEPSVTLSLRFVFASDRYEVTCADNGVTALAKLDVAPDAYDVIIVDQKMPNLTGVELVEAIRKRGIDTKVIVVSAHLSVDVCQAYERMDVSALFPKPFNIEQLRSTVDQLVR